VQIYVEIERARLTRKLAQLKEREGNIAEAADVLQEVAVVTLFSHVILSHPGLRDAVSYHKDALPSLHFD
jgi:hypothetical protein